MKTVPRIALTSGEPAGIGPDLCLMIARDGRDLSCELVCLADAGLLAARARLLGMADVELHRYEAPAGARVAERDAHAKRHAHAERHAREPGRFRVLDCPLAAPCEPGRLDIRNARPVLQMLDRAVDGCLAGEFDAIVTAPVQKSCMLDAGIAFSGHTEYLAARTGASRPVMMLAAAGAGAGPGALRVALATTHLPLSAVSAAITLESLGEILDILDRDLARWWRIAAPRIAVCGLNPHAGEGGHLGDEEVRTIAPAVARARERGIRADGPLPADTVFVPRLLERYDAVLAMYHDQGLPVIKHARFDSAVNVTLGLPLVRTSVDHGTALDLAGTGRAEPGSLLAAIRLAAEMAGD
ncbi:MAG: 4-hydroxythreonine-4-phosphate dehydrogenase PdxA [Steroidobacteraceae bacterium]